MDRGTRITLPESADGDNDVSSVTDYFIPICNLCGRTLLPDEDANNDFENMSLCGDCKSVLLQDLRTPPRNSGRRESGRTRRIRYSSSESTEDLFSHQFSNMINIARYEDHTTVDDATATATATATSLQPNNSSTTTPSSSVIWRQVYSDTESEGFENYGDNSPFGGSGSFLRYRGFNGDSDVISFSAYGGDSDVDMNSFLDTDMFIEPNDGSDSNSDMDIDPMHAGLNRWGSVQGDGEWEEADSEDESVLAGDNGQEADTQEHAIRSTLFNTTPDRFESDHLGMMHSRILELEQTLGNNTFFADLEESYLPTDITNSGDHIDRRGFEVFFRTLADIDDSRRGAPPAAKSAVKDLPLININEEHTENNTLACAICKDVLPIGTKANQLPCSHLYHSFCIVPWLSMRNSCPICRYELPTDDKEYENRKQNRTREIEIQGNLNQDVDNDDSSSDSFDEADDNNNNPEITVMEDQNVHPTNRNRWFFLAAAPVVSLVGIVVAVWLSNRQRQRLVIPSSLRYIQNPRGNRDRRWWSLF